MSAIKRKLLTLAALLLGIFLSIRYLLPLLFPFLLGGALALAAEPIVRFGCKRLHLPRPVCAGFGVTMSFAFLFMVILLLAALILRQLRLLAAIVPDLELSIRGGLHILSERLLQMVNKLPGSIATVLSRNIADFFSGSSAILDRITDYLLQLASGILSQVPGSALSLATAVISSFMISSKLPALKNSVHNLLQAQKTQTLLDTCSRLRSALFSWLKAQLKLSGITFTVAATGLLLLRVPLAPMWAVVIALVDAFPILGTGTVLVPWSLISFLQGDRLMAFGLLALYSAATVRLVGKQLGLDPLVTLIALYAGFKLFGLTGMIFAPVLAVATTQLLEINTGKTP